MRWLVAVALGAVVVSAAAQVDERRVDEILRHVEERANQETEAVYELGDYPKVIQMQRMRAVLRPWDEDLSTDLIWMLGNIENDGEALVVAKQFRLANPMNPNRGYAEAQLYNEWRMFARIPRVLEPDITKEPPPHRNSYTLLSAAYTRLGFHADVVRVLDIALRHYPDDAVFRRNRDRAAERLGG
jgi:hypothetical protein